MDSAAKRNKKKRIVKKIFLLCCAVTAGLIILLLLMFVHRPEYYNPLGVKNGEEVNPYFTHYLAPEFYNNIQLDEPFELIVPQKELNEMITDGATLNFQWPVKLNGASFDAPAVIFMQDKIVLMGKVVFAGVSFVVTIIAEPVMDEQGFIVLNIRQVRVGTVNVTPIAAMLADRIFAKKIQKHEDDDWIKGLSAACLSNTPYEPVFECNEIKVRIVDLKIVDSKLTLRFQPE